MSLERGLYQYLLNTPAVVTLLGNRIYPEAAPTERAQDYPYITYSQSGESPVHSMQGFSALTHARLALDIWTYTQPDREAVSRAIQSAINAWAKARADDCDIRRSTIEDQVDAYIPPTDGSERGVYQRTLDVDIWYRDI